jgi:hypothetical protein
VVGSAAVSRGSGAVGSAAAPSAPAASRGAGRAVAKDSRCASELSLFDACEAF